MVWYESHLGVWSKKFFVHSSSISNFLKVALNFYLPRLSKSKNYVLTVWNSATIFFFFLIINNRRTAARNAEVQTTTWIFVVREFCWIQVPFFFFSNWIFSSYWSSGSVKRSNLIMCIELGRRFELLKEKKNESLQYHYVNRLAWLCTPAIVIRPTVNQIFNRNGTTTKQ